jgi:DNA polymerase-1
VDYSQIELRVLAHITEDAALCAAFEKDLDIHAATASQIYNVDLESVTAKQRRNAKAVNFGIAYGQGAFGLAESLGIERKESTEIIAQYFNRFPGVRAYMDSVVEQGKKDGFVQSIFGRRRYLPELTSKNGRLRQFGERAAINAPIQGTASDLVKMAMIDVWREGVPGMILQVHDELLFEISEAEIDRYQTVTRRLMENVSRLKVPLRVNCAIGKNWEEAHA